MNTILRFALLALHLLSTVYLVYTLGDTFSSTISVVYVFLAGAAYFLMILGLIFHIKEFILFINNQNKNKQV